MAVPVEEAIPALSTFSLEDEQPEVQGPGVWVSTERGATESPIEYCDVAAYKLSLSEDTKALNQLNSLTQEGKEMTSVLYTYRSCVKALTQLPDSIKQSQDDLYLETYQAILSKVYPLSNVCSTTIFPRQSDSIYVCSLCSCHLQLSVYKPGPKQLELFY